MSLGNSTQQDLYCLLNIKQDATEVEIKQSFKFLSRLFHPDKLTFDNETITSNHGEECSIVAASNFQQIVYAYEILSDPHKRTIYDLYGHEGLSKYYGLCSVTTDQSLEHIIFLLKQHKLAEVKRSQDRELKCLSKATVTIDASDTFDPYQEYSGSILPDLHSISLDQRFVSHLSDNLSGTLGYKVENSYGRGIGTISSALSFVPSLSNQYLLACGAGSEKYLNIMWTRLVSSGFYFQLGMNSPIRANSLYPHIQASIVKGLPYNCTLLITLLLGYQNVTAVTIRKTYGSEQSCIAECTLRHTLYSETQLELKNRHFISGEREYFLKNKLKISSLGHSFQIGIGGLYVSSSLRGSFSVETGSLFGVIVRISIGKIDEATSISIPIFLSHEFDPLLSLFGAILPPVLTLSASFFFLQPIRKILSRWKRRDQLVDERRVNHETFIKTSQLMSKIAQRKVAIEVESNGLVIKWAAYGPINEEWNGENCLDITNHLNVLVDTGTHSLKLNVSPSRLIGMYDPCIGEEKCTKLEYSFNGVEFNACFEEDEFIILPQLVN